MTSQLDELNAALEIAGQRLVEADKAYRAASDAARRTHVHRLRCEEDLVALLKGLREASGERIHDVWLDPENTLPPNGEGPWPLATAMSRVHIGVDGCRVSPRKVAAVIDRLLSATGVHRAV